MENQRRGKTLVVLILLQLCRAEIKDTNPQWYSANIINDGFQPKSLSETFSTESQPPFSTAIPIIVSSDFSKSYAGEDVFSSTLAPPTSFYSTKSPGYTRHTTSNLELVSPLKQQFMTHMTTPSQQTTHFDQTSIEISHKTSPSDFDQTHSLLVSELPPQPHRNVQIQQDHSTQSTWTFHPSSTVTEAPTVFKSTLPETTLSGEIHYEFPQTKSTIGPQQMIQGPQKAIHLPPNYFLIYQQGPQSFPNTFSPDIVTSNHHSPRTTAQETFTTSSPVFSTVSPTLSSTFSSTIPSTLSSSLSTFSSSTPTTIHTSPVLISSTSAPVTKQLSSSTFTPRVTVASTSTRGSSFSTSSISSKTPNRQRECRNPTTPIPSTYYGKHPDGILFPFKIRVLTPSGSITNVNINPVNKIYATTKKPTTTTRRATTKRTPRPKKNTYDRCLHGCRKHGQTLCAAPLGQNPINPDTLRGFPSACHMACHNSYRKHSYEKIIEGSCGKLRTRIRPIDSSSKLKKDELHKVQYILDNPGQKAIVEFTGLHT